MDVPADNLTFHVAFVFHDDRAAAHVALEGRQTTGSTVLLP